MNEARRCLVHGTWMTLRTTPAQPGLTASISWYECADCYRDQYQGSFVVPVPPVTAAAQSSEEQGELASRRQTCPHCGEPINVELRK